MRTAVFIFGFLALTILTQLGGLALLAAQRFRRKWLAFIALYAAIFVIAQFTAPLFGRQALPCFGDTLRSQSPIYCVMLRNFVSPEMYDTAQHAARVVATEYPGTVTLTLDGSFPFFDGIPLLPHLSHDDGEKLDFVFYYQRDGAYLPGKARSPIGYWAFESTQDSGCPPVWLTTRWNFEWMQGFFPDRPLEPARTTALLNALLGSSAVKKVFVEPYLARDLGVEHPNLRFQGCRAARHDDHIHAQL